MSVQILDGVLSEEDALQRIRSFISKAHRLLGDPWRCASIDAERDGLSLGDLLIDESARLHSRN